MRKAVAVLAAVAAFGVGAAAGNAGSRARAPFCSGLPTKPSAGPIGYGEKTTFWAAQRAVPFTLLTHFGGPRPSIDPSSVWLATSAGIVATVYDDEDITMYMSAGQYHDLQGGLQDLLPTISSTDSTASVDKVVEGHWALLIQPGTDACGSNPAALQTQLYGTGVEIYSDTRSVDDLVAFANTLLPDTAK